MSTRQKKNLNNCSQCTIEFNKWGLMARATEALLLADLIGVRAVSTWDLTLPDARTMCRGFIYCVL